jgi:thioredoxin-dependent peroxiredoxin
MANVTLKCNPFTPSASFPRSGQSPAPNFRLTRGDLSDISLANFEGTVKNPQYRAPLDTGVAAASARRFDKGDAGISAPWLC